VQSNDQLQVSLVGVQLATAGARRVAFPSVRVAVQSRGALTLYLATHRAEASLAATVSSPRESRGRVVSVAMYRPRPLPTDSARVGAGQSTIAGWFRTTASDRDGLLSKCTKAVSASRKLKHARERRRQQLVAQLEGVEADVAACQEIEERLADVSQRLRHG
jgi:hypothetical protein